MRISKFFSAIFGMLGVAAAAACVALSFLYMNAGPVLVEAPAEARDQVVELMDAVCGNDFNAVSQLVHGTPDFGVDREPEDAVGSLIWNAFVESVHYELDGEMYATDSGVAQNITITALDMASVTANLKDRSAALLEKRVAEAEDTSEVYDENNDYRESFVMETLYDAAVQALEEDAQAVTQSVTVNLLYENGRWWVVSDPQLLSAISGGVLK